MKESLYYDGGAIVSESEDFDLKIESNRGIYIRYHRGDRKSKQYKSINREIDYGLMRDEKKLFILELRTKIREKLMKTDYYSEEEAKKLKDDDSEEQEQIDNDDVDESED